MTDAYRIIILPEASANITDIHTHIEQTSPQNAAAVVRKVRSAGGYFVIHSVALGHFVGFTTSWLWFLFEPLVPAALSMLFGQVLSDFVLDQTGLLIPWWIVSIALIAILTWTSYIGIRQSSKTTFFSVVLARLTSVIWHPTNSHRSIVMPSSRALEKSTRSNRDP